MLDSHPQRATEVQTTCPYCGVGCGVLATPTKQGGVEVRGDPQHPSNFGRLCSKGAALGETVGLQGRLLQPQQGGQVCSWDEALQTTAEALMQAIAAYGPDAVGFYASGQLLTEDYYLANKLMKGFIGSANIDTNSRLCMSSSVAGHQRAFGADTVPGCYQDLEQADLIVAVGSNTAWCHPVLFQRILQAKQNRKDLQWIVIDPRHTASCEMAELHLPIRPGTDAFLFDGLLVYLYRNGYCDAAYIDAHTQGLEEALRIAEWYAPTPQVVAAHCDLPEQDVVRFYQLFAKHPKVVSLYSQGINQSSSGTDKVNSILNCHLCTGRIGQPGQGPFSLTGQPNAMGGREVGALANQLCAHMELDNPQHREIVQRYWQAPRLAMNEGYKALEMFRAVEQGRIKVLWIMATNPVVSMPDADRVRRALARCDTLIVSDCMHPTDTTAQADILLPALTWGEKEGTVTNSERRISRQRAFLPPPGQAKPDWWIIAQVAIRMGFGWAFSYPNCAAIFREFASLSAFDNHGERGFNLEALAHLTEQEYQQLQPVQWPVTRAHPKGTQRLFHDGQFSTNSGKARFVAIVPRPPGNLNESNYPLILNTGRVRDHWHTMTRTGKSARLSGHIPEPYAELHPQDAKDQAIVDGALVQVTSRWGEVIVRAQVAASQRLGSVFVPIHWNSQFASAGRIGSLVNPVVDPISGQPEFKHTPVRVVRYQPVWYGFILSCRRITPHQATYWIRAKGAGLWRHELAGEEAPEDWATCARQVLCTKEDQAEWVELFDQAAMRYRAARIVQGRLDSCVFIGPEPMLPARDWLASLFGKTNLTDQERAWLLAGRPNKDQDRGRIVCACANVGLNVLTKAIRSQALTSIEAIGTALQAGTNCGSCKPELQALLAKETRKK